MKITHSIEGSGLESRAMNQESTLTRPLSRPPYSGSRIEIATNRGHYGSLCLPLILRLWSKTHGSQCMTEKISQLQYHLKAPKEKPEFMNEYRKRYGWHDLNDEYLAEIAATYYGMVSRVDDQFGRLLSAIDSVGDGENTVTFFFSDHGEYLGDSLVGGPVSTQALFEIHSLWLGPMWGKARSYVEKLK